MVTLSFDAIVAEHDRQLLQVDALRQLLQEQPARLADALAQLSQMNEGLEAHLAEEEQTLFPDLLRRLPDCSTIIDGLLREHVALLAGMTTLRIALRSPEDAAQMVKLTLAYADLFARHAVREQQLMARAQLLPG